MLHLDLRGVSVSADRPAGEIIAGITAGRRLAVGYAADVGGIATNHHLVVAAARTRVAIMVRHNSSKVARPQEFQAMAPAGRCGQWSPNRRATPTPGTTLMLPTGSGLAVIPSNATACARRSGFRSHSRCCRSGVGRLRQLDRRQEHVSVVAVEHLPEVDARRGVGNVTLRWPDIAEREKRSLRLYINLTERLGLEV